MADDVPKYNNINVDVGGSKKKSDDLITIRIRPRTLERAGFITVIIALLIIIALYTPLFGLGSCSDSISQDSSDLTVSELSGDASEQAQEEVQEETAETVVEEPEVEEPSAEEVVVATTEEETAEEESAPEPEVLTGTITSDDVELVINSVTTVTKTEFWGKVSEVQITLTNNGPAFKPEFEVYVYTESMPQNPDDTFKYDIPIKTGVKEINKKLMSDIGGISVSDLDIDKTIVVTMKDRETGNVLKTATKKFSFD